MRNRTARYAVLAATLVLALAAAPRIFFFWRDNFSTHFPLRAAAEPLVLTLWNPLVGGGQPFAGNPNVLAFYPGSLLYALLPPFAAFNLHFLLHWLAGIAAMRALLRAWAIPRPWDLAGAMLWGLSGAAVSAFAFYNLAPSLALVPLALLACQRIAAGGGGGAALSAGAAFGLLALAGEPATLLATTAVAAILFVPRLVAGETPRPRALAAGVLAIAVAAAIAAPMLIAWSEIAAETERGARSYSAETVLAASLSPWQLAEMLLGPVRGLPTDYTPAGWRGSGAASPWPPFFLYLYVGALAVPALAAAPRTARRIQIAALLLLFVALGRFNPLVSAVIGDFPLLRGLRYPEKLALPLTALLVALIASWLAKETRDGADRVAAAAGAVGVVVLAALVISRESFSAAMRERSLLATAIALSIFILAALPPRRALRAALAAVTIGLAAIFAVAAAPVDLARYYRARPAVIAPGQRIVRLVAERPSPSSARAEYRMAAASAEPVWGAAFGIAYALDKSPDGMYSFLSRIVRDRARGDARRLARWSRLAGASAIVTERPLAAPELGVPRRLDAPEALFAQPLRAPLPLVHPVRVVATASIDDAIALLESGETDVRRVAAGPPGSGSDGELRLRGAARIHDGWRIDVDPQTAGALLVNESWFRAWQARDRNGGALRVFPLNVDRTGIAVPRGTSAIVLRFGRMRGPIRAAWVASWLLLAAIGIGAVWPRKRTRDGRPAS